MVGLSQPRREICPSRPYFLAAGMNCNEFPVCVPGVLGSEETSLSTSTSLETPSVGFYPTIFSVALETGEENRIT